MSVHRCCPEPSCSLANTRVLLEEEASYLDAEGRTASVSYELRLCDRCQLGFVHPIPPEEVLERFYTSDYAYYQAAGDHPDQEAGSLKYTLARMRYLHLLRPGLGNGVRSLLAALAETLTRKTVTFTLGVPLALPRDARILDYGYGSGSWLLSLRRLGYSRLAGFDIGANSERGRELAAQGIEVIAPGEMERLAPASLDCVRLEHVFEHLVDPQTVLRDLHRLIRPGGLLAMTFPSIYPWLEVEDLAASPFRPYLQLPIHVAHHSVESAAQLLCAAGFALVSTRVTRGERFVTVLARRSEGREVAA